MSNRLANGAKGPSARMLTGRGQRLMPWLVALVALKSIIMNYSLSLPKTAGRNASFCKQQRKYCVYLITYGLTLPRPTGKTSKTGALTLTESASLISLKIHYRLSSACSCTFQEKYSGAEKTGQCWRYWKKIEYTRVIRPMCRSGAGGLPYTIMLLCCKCAGELRTP